VRRPSAEDAFALMVHRSGFEKHSDTEKQSRMRTKILLFFLLVGAPLFLVGQKKITLEDLYAEYKFSARGLPGFHFQNDGRHYTLRRGNRILQYDLTTGEQTAVLFDVDELPDDAPLKRLQGYSFSEDESKLLLWTERRRIYRHSWEAFFYVWDRRSKTLTPVFPEARVRLATFNPQADKVAFVFLNNLYALDLQTMDYRVITNDGKVNEIINGATDWVYEEEFSFARAYEWAPDGEKIAFYRFDEREVPQFTMLNYTGELYPEPVTFKYPKVGQPNSKVSIHIYHFDNGQTGSVRLENQLEYIPRIKWTQDPNLLCVFNMNRHQNRLELHLVDARTGKTRLLLEETNQWYIDIHDNLTFLEDGRHFLWTSEQDGWNHLYLYDLDGRLVRQVTRGEWELTAFYGVDEKTGEAFIQAARPNELQRQVLAVNIHNGKERLLSPENGWNGATFSSSFDYFVLNHSTLNTPTVYSVLDRQGNTLRIIEDNAHVRRLQEEYAAQPVEFFTFSNPEGDRLNGYMIKPPDFDPSKQYPVFMYLYGGPGSQQVTDRMPGHYWWFQMLAQEGFIIACVDNRGTGGRGEAFKKMTYLQLGHYETLDQIAAARYLGSLPYTDPNRIGIFGWSYGGYMSSLCLLKGNDVFKAAIAVAPVTNWKWYDTIYTERFMRTEEENPDGYRNNSPVNFADRLRGNYLLVHGMSDDNVHFQNTVEMAEALIRANKQFDTYFYPNRNHGIYGNNARLHLFTKMTQFLREKLMNDHRPVGD